MDRPNIKRFGDALRAGRWFRGLSVDFQQKLLEAAEVRSLAKGTWLFARGDAPTGLFAVVEGAMRISATAPNGKEVLLAMVEPPMWFGEISVFDGQPRTHDAITEEAAVVVHVPQESLEAILRDEPRHWRDLGLLVTAKLRLAFGMMEDFAVLPLGVRLVRRLVLAAERYGEWNDRTSRVVDLRQEQLATMLTASRQTVNQLLKDLETRGLVRLSYGQIEIVDLEGLRRASVSPVPVDGG